MRIVGGAFRGRTLKTASGPGYRPATGRVRESVFSMLQSCGVVWDGLRVLDAFAGSGALGFECLSRGARSVTFVEKQSRACAVLQENARALGLSSDTARIIRRDVLRMPAGQGEERFGLCFLDPPYGRGLLQPALEQLLNGLWLEPDAVICAEVEKDLVLDFACDLSVLRDRVFGQTRILIWKRN